MNEQLRLSPDKRSRLLRSMSAMLLAGFVLPVYSQQNTEPKVPTKAEAEKAAATEKKSMTTGVVSEVAPEEEIVVLSPFEVTAAEDKGYLATSTLAGTRIRSQLRDVGPAISVYTEQFMRDTGSRNLEDLMIYTTNGEMGGVRGNFSGITVNAGGSTDETGTFTRQNTNNRVRGLGGAENTRDYYITDVPSDSYNTGRWDMLRGANSMLFGLGSPSGISNSTLNSAVLTKNSGRFETRVDQFGTFRNSLDYNHVLLPNELAVRLDLLVDKKKYRQKPAFEDDKRGYASLRYEPKFLAKNGMKTSLRANYEHGEIKGMRPRTLPPIDRMSPWFNPDTIVASANPLIGKPEAIYYAINRRVFNNWDMTNNDRRSVGPTNPNYDPNVNFAAEGGRNWINPANLGQASKTYVTGYLNNPYYQPFISEVYTGGAMGFYENGSSSPFGMYVTGNATGQYGFNNSTNNGPKFKTSPIGVVEDGNVDYFRYAQWQAIAEPWKSYRYLQIPYGGLWRDPSITNTNVFDFFNNSLDGDNRRHWRNFDTFNTALDQTFFNNRAGISVVYDLQKYDDGSHSIFNDRTQTITIDVNATYPNGLPNPNAGRALMLGDGNYNTSKRERSEFRATAFGELRATDFMKKSKLSDILGRHVLTGMMSKNVYTKEDRGYRRFMLNPTDLEGIARNLYISGDPTSYRTQVYMSDNLQNTTKYPNMSALRLQPLQGLIAPTSIDFQYFDSHWVPSTTVGDPTYVNPAAAWTDTYSGATNSRQKNNPANYVGWRRKQVGVLDATRDSDRYRMGTSLNLDRSIVNSQAFVWQGFFFNGNIVPVFGYREDKKAIYLFQSGSAGLAGQSGIYRPEAISVTSPGLSPTNLPANPGGVRTQDGFIIDGSPNIALPSSVRFGGYDSFINRSWSLVGHAPQFIRQYLPWGTSISLSYNESTNVNPGQAGRTDLLGRPVAATGGKTRDVGVLVSMLQNRVNFRILKYKSTTQREGASGLNTGMIKEVEGRAWVAAKKMQDAIRAAETKDYLNVPLPGVTQYISSFENSNYLYGTANPANTNQVLYSSQAEKDALLARGRADSQRVLNNAPVDLFNAWGVDMVGDTWRNTTDIGNLPPGLTATRDIVSEGMEYEMTVSPLKNWRITGNFSTTKAKIDNVFQNMRDVVFARTAVWSGPQGTFYYSNPGRETTAYRDIWNTQVLSTMTSGLFSDGLSVQEGVKKRGNLISTYDFQKGFLKGFTVGGAYRWEEKSVIGNRYKTIPYSLNTGTTTINYLFEVPDREQPIYAPSQEAVDLWFAYSRKLTRTVNWKIQVNVYNAQGHTKLVPISTQPDGTYAQYRIKEGASWALTNSFTF